MQPVTTNRLHAPCVLCCAISRMVSIDSFFAESMNAQVLTTRTSADAASCVNSWPACCARPSMTSESTRFLGQPSEIRPIFIEPFQQGQGTGDRGGASHNADVFASRLSLSVSPVPCPLSLRIEPVKHARIGNGLAHVFELAD